MVAAEFGKVDALHIMYEHTEARSPYVHGESAELLELLFAIRVT